MSTQLYKQLQNYAAINVYVVSYPSALKSPQKTVSTVPSTVASVSISTDFTLSKEMVCTPDFKQIRFGFSHINIIGKVILILHGSDARYHRWFSV